MKKRFTSILLSLTLLCSIAAPAAAVESEQVKDLLDQYYVDDIPSEIMDQDTIDGLLSALNDPYTEYYTQEQYKKFLDSVNGNAFVGIGISITAIYDNGYKIQEILPDSPALAAGLHAGDYIIAVDGVPMTEASNIQAAISGEEGTSVSITVRRGDTGLEDELTLVRRVVRIPIVTFEQKENVGFIDCASFGQSTAATVLNALHTMEEDVDLWVMDLRDNSGGMAEAAAATTSFFTGGGILVYFQYHDKHCEYIYAPLYLTPATKHPLILLLNSESASASELTAAAIRDYRCGIAIGQRSYGKGISQIILDQNTHPQLFDGDSFKVTTSRFYSPKETTNHLVGVLPTLLIDEEYVDAAVALLSAPAPAQPHDHLKLELAGNIFYIDRDTIVQGNHWDAFTHLLESLPPSAKLYRGISTRWYEISPQKLSMLWDLNFTPRTYRDIGSSSYKTEINTLAAYGLLPQYEGTHFQPTQVMTRGEFCTLVANALNLPENPDLLSSFTDVPSQSPHAGAISALLNRGFISGHGNATFDPDTPITFEEVACALSQAASWLNMPAYALGERGVSIGEWLDYYEYEDWAEDAVWHLEQLNVSTEFMAPGKTITREEGAGMLCRLMESLHLFWK